MKIGKLLSHCFFFTLGSLLLLSHSLAAQTCLPFLTKQENSEGTVRLTTLNKNGVASWSEFEVSFRPSGKSPNGGVRPAHWYTNLDALEKRDESKQLFSDRFSNFIQNSPQPFDIGKPDLINAVITVERSPQITVSLRSWGNTKATFRATCSQSGIMHASTGDVDYLLLFITKPLPL